MKHMFTNEGISRVSIFVRVIILGQISLDGSVQHLNTMEGKVCIWFSSKVLPRRLIFNTLPLKTWPDTWVISQYPENMGLEVASSLARKFGKHGDDFNKIGTHGQNALIISLPSLD
jgi:hypothetical protein